MMSRDNPLVTLNNGVQMPALGLGMMVFRTPIRRDEVFIETKIWISDYGYEATRHAFEKSARKLGVEYLDLLLLHQPVPTRFDLTLEAYRGLENLLSDGNVRGARRHREAAWQVAGAGDATLASAARSFRYPEVDQSRAHCREVRRIRLRSFSGRDGRDRRVGDGPATRP